jgi:hypothetical protein
VFFRNFRLLDVPQAHAVTVGPKPFNLAAEGTVHRQHYLNVFYIGNIPENHRLVGQKGGGKTGQGGVFIAAGPDGSVYGESAFDNIFIHKTTLPG